MESLSGIALMIPYQIMMKMFTFFMNSFFILRLTLPEVKGKVFQLEFITQTILFFCREGFRKSAKRVSNEKHIWNLAILVVPFGAVITACTYIFYSDPYLHLFLIACSFELLMEPLYIMFISDYKYRMIVEFCGTFCKYLILVFLEKTVWNFAIAQILSCVIMFLCYLIYYLRVYSLTFSGNFFSYEDSSVTNVFIFLYQSILKFLLTEGEKFLLFSFFVTAEQGVYDVCFHLGSLVPRMIFQPIEEVSNTAWSKLLNQKEVTPKEYQMSYDVFQLILKYLILFSLYFVAFGFHLTTIAIRLIYGEKWSQTDLDVLLSCFCIYILFLAVNGITESFAVASQQDISKHNYFMIFTSGVYFLLSYVILINYRFTWVLILTNSLNLGLRVIYSFWFIRSYFSTKNIKVSVPYTHLYILFLTMFCLNFVFQNILVIGPQILITTVLVYRENDFKLFLSTIKGKNKSE
jgi:oligosaccharide translocation protein RFT1